jgi:putative addiction module component (TIGR02574 family)
MSDADVAEILKLPPEERLRLAEIIWESLAADRSSVPLGNAHRAVIDERLAEHERNPDNVVSRDQVLAEAQRASWPCQLSTVGMLDGISLVGSGITKDKAKALAKSFLPPLIPRSTPLSAIQKCFRVYTAKCGAPFNANVRLHDASRAHIRYSVFGGCFHKPPLGRRTATNARTTYSKSRRR